MDDLGLDFLTFLVELGRALDLLAGKFGNVHQTFDAFFHFHEQTEVSDVGHHALHGAAHGVGAGHVAPRIIDQLLDAQGELFVFLVNGQHLGLHGVAHLVDLVGMTHLLGPADVGHVDEAVDAVFDTDEHTEFGDVLDDAFEDGAFRILFGHQFPGIGTDLLHAQADALLLAVHTQDDDFDFVTGVHHLGRMTQLAGPGHFGDVHQAFHAGFQFHERTVVHQVGDLAGALGTFGEAGGDVLPRIGHQLLEAQGDLVVLAVEGEHLQGQVLTHGDHFLGMADALPAHVGDVQQAVQTAQVHEHAVFGDVLGLAVHDLAFFQGAQQILTLGITLFFQQHAAGNDHVAAAAVDLQHAEFEFLVDQSVHVGHGTQVHMRARQKSFNPADVHGVAALDATHDVALDDPVVFLHVFELVKDLHALGLLKGQRDGAFHFVLANDVDIHTVAHADGHVAGGVTELAGRDLAFGLEVHVHQNIVVIHANDLALGDRAFFEVAEVGIEIVFKGAFETHFAFVPGFLVCHA